MTKQEQIEAFLASKGATKCPPTSTHKNNAKSLRHLRSLQEQACDPMYEDPEVQSEREREEYLASKAAGADRDTAWNNAQMAR